MEGNQSNQLKSASGVDVEMRISHKTNFSLNHLPGHCNLVDVLGDDVMFLIQIIAILIKPNSGFNSLSYILNKSSSRLTRWFTDPTLS